MGVSVSTNSIDNMVKSATAVINDYSQVCSISGTGAFNNNISLKGCTIDNTHFNLSNTTAVSQNCMVSANTQTALSSSISQTMRQSAQAITQQFSFPSFAKADNFIKNSVLLADTISETFKQTCNSAASGQQNTITCTDSKITNSVFELQNYQTLVQNCMLKSIQQTNIYKTLINDFDETAVAKNNNTFAAILFAFVLLIAIFCWALISVANTDIVKWGVLILVIVFVISSIVYAVTAQKAGNYPYKKP